MLGNAVVEPYRVAKQANHADKADEEEWLPSLPTYATRGFIGRQLMGPLDERSEMASTSSQQERVSREQASTQILIGESLVQLPVKGKFVSMRKLDFWLNATQILVLAGKNEKQIKWTLGIMRKRTTVQVDMARTSTCYPTAWVCFGHSRLLYEALDLTDVLKRLFDYPPLRTITLEAQQAGQLNYLLRHFIFNAGKAKVELQKLDFWINATHIMYAAGRTRNAVTTLRKENRSRNCS